MVIRQLFRLTRMANRVRSFFLLVSMLLAASADAENWGWNMPQGVTPISHNIYHLHMIIFYICVVIGVLVFSVMFYAMVKHRKSKGAVAANFHDHLGVEILWTIIPALILVAMAVPATRVLKAMHNMERSQVNIKITGHQWYWEYAYLDRNIKFYSRLSTPLAQINNKAPKDKWYLKEVDRPLVLPIHKKIRLLITSHDVNHSWWVPQLGVKKDAMAGLVTESWVKIEKPGVYRGNCTELCGMHHAYMPIVVVALNDHDYGEWIASQQHGIKVAPATLITAAHDEEKGVQEALHIRGVKHPKVKKAVKSTVLSKADLMKEGKVVYTKHCAVCHKADGSGMPPVFPAMKGAKIATGPHQAHIDMILHGKTGTAMQAFAGQLSDQEIAAVATYERQAFGNANKKKYGKDAGGLIKSTDVAKARKNKLKK